MGNEALFRDKPIWKAIFSLAIPSVLTILIMVIYNMADMFFIAMLGDDAQVAAIAVVGPVFSLATAVATMLGAGGCAVIANYLEFTPQVSKIRIPVWKCPGSGNPGTGTKETAVSLPGSCTAKQCR